MNRLLSVIFSLIFLVSCSPDNQIDNKQTTNIDQVINSQNEWLSFGFDSCNTRSILLQNKKNITNLKELWHYDAEAEILSTPVIYKDKILFGSRDGSVYCLDKNTGNKIWSKKYRDYIYHPFSIYKDKLLFDTDEMIYYCLNIDTGDENWKVNLGSVVNGAVINDGVVYSSLLIGKIVCLSLDNGRIIWEYKCPDKIESIPLFVNNKIIFGAWDGNVYCLNSKDGLLIWSSKTRNWIRGSASVYNNLVFIGSRDNILYCINIDNGSKIWEYETLDEIFSTPMVYNNKVYFGSIDNYFYCLDVFSGKKVWTFDTLYGIQNSPSIAYGNIFLSTDDGKILCMDPENGSIQASLLLTSDGIGTSCIISNEKIYVGSLSGNRFYCINIESKE